MLDDAPVRFSVTNCGPWTSPVLAPTARAVISAVGPGANPLTMCTGCVGNSCACAGTAAKASTAAAAAMSDDVFTISSLDFRQENHAFACAASCVRRLRRGGAGSPGDCRPRVVQGSSASCPLKADPPCRCRQGG